jgi:hypothetical protein
MEHVNDRLSKQYGLYDEYQFERDEYAYKYRVNCEDKLETDHNYHQLIVLKCSNIILKESNLTEQNDVIWWHYQEKKLYDNNYLQKINNFDNGICQTILLI